MHTVLSMLCVLRGQVPPGHEICGPIRILAGFVSARDVSQVVCLSVSRYHPAMKSVVPVRKSLKVRTAFNMLGPLLNPARAAYGLVGVYSMDIAPLMAETLQRLGVRKALVVHSMGLDELTPMGDADVLEVSSAGTRAYR
jgi:anthranilate phosphoribosyltransferase